MHSSGLTFRMDGASKRAARNLQRCHFLFLKSTERLLKKIKVYLSSEEKFDL